MSQEKQPSATDASAPTLHHQLNNIMMIIAGYADLIALEYPDSPFAQEVHEIGDAARRAKRLMAEHAPVGRVTRA